MWDVKVEPSMDVPQLEVKLHLLGWKIILPFHLLARSCIHGGGRTSPPFIWELSSFVW